MKKEHKPTFHNRGPLYFEQDGTPKKCKECGNSGPIEHELCEECVGYTESDNVIQKVGLDAFNDLAESHESHVRQVKKLEEELNRYKQLDCEGINMDGTKGKITYIETFTGSGWELEPELLVKWIQDTQSETDLQTKTSKEILEDYFEDTDH